METAAENRESLSTLRRRAAAADLRIRKPSERSRWFGEYGPFARIDIDTNGIVAVRLLEQVEAARLVRKTRRL